MPTTNRDFLLAMLGEVNAHSPGYSKLGIPDGMGVQWAAVGHNSTHRFELGVDHLDRLWQRSSGEEWEKGKERPRFVTSAPALVERGKIGYTGHL